MTQSEQITDLATALAKAQTTMTLPKRNREVTVKSEKGSYKFEYTTFDAIIEHVREPLTTNGLWFVQTTEIADGANTLRTTLVHSSGQWISGSVRVPPATKMQEFGSALTYLKRYALSSLLGIASEDDDDANAADGNTIEARQDKTPQRREPERRSEPAAKPPSAVATFLKGKSLSIVVPGAKAGKPDYTAWGNSLWKAVGACEDVRTLERLWADNSDQLFACKKADPALHDEVEKAADLRRYDLSQPQTTTLAAE